MVVYGRISLKIWAEDKVVSGSSVEVGFFWEGAPRSSDDDVGGIVCCFYTPIQWFLLDQL